MDSFEYFKSLIQQDINELEKQNYDNSQIEKINNFFDLFLNPNPNFDSRVNINIEQRINHLYESEKKGINPDERNRIAKSIDTDVKYWFGVIKNSFTVHSIGDIHQFWAEIDDLLQIEEFIISLYTEEMTIKYTNELNCYRKRVLLLLSEKSKKYNISNEKFYISDFDRKEALKKFNNYLPLIKETENTYIPPKFDSKPYESLKRKKYILKNIMSILLLLTLIILGILSYNYDTTLFKIYIFIILFPSFRSYRWHNRFRESKRDVERNEKQIFNYVKNSFEKDFRK